MDTRRPAKTLADYLVIAASPALIMIMVHSVCFFLMEVFYRGAAIGGVRWVLFWFVLAVVLIARIGIEQGDGHAMIYGLALALVTWLYLSTIQPNVLFGALLLAIVWFTAHKLTCNCTLIDDDADASGQGLLQSILRLPRKLKKPPTAAAKTNVANVAATLKPSSAPAASTPKAKATKSQIPGVWLIYFSLAALPIFGFGQMLLPAADMAARHQGFIYLFLYLAAALGLLVTTSFLGLRRYLRQRYLVMPGNIAFGWVQFGVASAAIVLCLSLLLPRPGAGEAWGALRYQVDYQLHRASKFAARFNPHGTGSGHAGNQTSPASQPPSGQSSGANRQQNPSANDHVGEKSSSTSKQGIPEGGKGSGQSERPMPHLPPVASAVYPWVKILFWLVAVGILVWLLFRHRAAIGMALRSAWAAIRKFIADLLGWFRPKSTASPTTSKNVAVPRFNTFKNPFLTGGDRVWPPEKLIIYSYEALQSWAMESDAQHGSPQTPREFCRQLGEEMPEAAEALEHLAYLYGHVVYGASLPGQYHPEQLHLLWDVMSGPRPARPEPTELTPKPG
jgi:hypothetical protein